MKENSHDNMSDKSDRSDRSDHIDELLNSFIDGELAAGQQAEVERLIAQNARVAQRLRQLQRCKMLVGSLPCAQVPVEVVEGIKASLAGMTIPDQTWVSEQWARRKHGLRPVLATAAMIGLGAILAASVYTILAPQATPEKPVAIEPPGTTVQTPGAPGAATLASLGFSGRLELKTGDLAAVSTFVNRAIEDRGLSDTVRQDKHIYSLSCNRKELDALLADLETIWPQLDAATLFVNTDVFGKPVAVNNVTTGQIAQIADQNSLQKRIEVAKDFDALNTIAARLPGREILAAIQGQNNIPVRQWRVPIPVLTTDDRQTAVRPPSQAQEQEMIRLTIVVNW